MKNLAYRRNHLNANGIPQIARSGNGLAPPRQFQSPLLDLDSMPRYKKLFELPGKEFLKMPGSTRDTRSGLGQIRPPKLMGLPK